jgi:molybdate transport system regulatory protein
VSSRPALGPGKVRLLDAIAATRSLSAAAKQLKMSYRLAWQHLRMLEERTGITVVEPQRGGRSGGGTELTREGRALLEAYHNFRREVEEHAQSACYRHFAKWAPR